MSNTVKYTNAWINE